MVLIISLSFWTAMVVCSNRTTQIVLFYGHLVIRRQRYFTLRVQHGIELDGIIVEFYAVNVSSNEFTFDKSATKNGMTTPIAIDENDVNNCFSNIENYEKLTKK
ncbi:6884_t:CDS:2 [Funneliformis geosporum]|uniref:6884_t:CDS:1 n=1 Tax=Funneliformis geosporum TaxID=1117311 RepID=A0A9W4SR79_9GLOM|nr:6884_t:CDS:2 [Funneliformis geosporum]